MGEEIARKIKYLLLDMRFVYFILFCFSLYRAVSKNDCNDLLFEKFDLAEKSKQRLRMCVNDFLFYFPNFCQIESKIITDGNIFFINSFFLFHKVLVIEKLNLPEF